MIILLAWLFEPLAPRHLAYLPAEALRYKNPE